MAKDGLQLSKRGSKLIASDIMDTIISVRHQDQKSDSIDVELIADNLMRSVSNSVGPAVNPVEESVEYIVYPVADSAKLVIHPVADSAKLVALC